jgi:hypothetical protein
MSKTPKMLKGAAGNVVGSALSPTNVVRVINEPNSLAQDSTLVVGNYKKGFGNVSLQEIQ